MKRFVLTVLFAVMLTLMSGCTVSERSHIVVEPAPPVAYADGPVYVYTYPDGGCWADGVWYAPCRWRTGPYYGYYYYTGGAYVHRPGISWEYRHGHPPPWHHHHYAPSRRYVPPAYHAPSRRSPPSRNHDHGGRRF